MNNTDQWLHDIGTTESPAVEGLVLVANFDRTTLAPEAVSIMEKARYYGAYAVFFEAQKENKPQVAQAFVYVSDGPAEDDAFAGEKHKRLWSWGGVPLIYRKTPGLVQLFRCAHKPDFEVKGEIVFNPYKTLDLNATITQQIEENPWWDAAQLRNGTLWDKPEICKQLLSTNRSAQKTLIAEVKRLYDDLSKKGILPLPLRRKLLILSVLIRYLEERRVFDDGFFGQFLTGASQFFEVLADGPALVKLLDNLEERFNGHIFILTDEQRETLKNSQRLARFSQLVEGKQEASGQLTLWERYSFADLPVELISHIYQLFVTDKAVAVYTPHFLVRLILEEVLSWDRLDRLVKNNEIILDPACGSGVFLVEAYKRLVLHWRSRNRWKRPDDSVLRKLTERVHGIDLEPGAVELAAFSLCLALCDALQPEEIRASVKLFPELQEKSIHSGCFFELCEQGVVKEAVGVVIGNPPFTSTLSTEGAKRVYMQYQQEHGVLPDKQLSYLFLHQSMKLLAEGGVLALLQHYGFLYNQNSLEFRREFIRRWNVREILDFISVRGLFQKGGADTKIIVVVAEATPPIPEQQILHATFRRSGRADAEQGFDIDYYDLHWLPRELVLTNDGVWRSDLVGGGRVLDFVDRMKKFRTLKQYADCQGWDSGEGFIVGSSGKRKPAPHLTNKHCLPSEAILANGIDKEKITLVKDELFHTPYSEKRFTAPMVLVREQMDLDCGSWLEGYLTYKSQVVGFSNAHGESELVDAMESWIHGEQVALRAFVAATSVKLFTQHATTLSEIDILSLPYPESLTLDLSLHEQILVDDIVDYYRDLIRLGEGSSAMKEHGLSVLDSYNETYIQQINAIYKNNLRALDSQVWPGVICQPFVFGNGEVDWSGADGLKIKINNLLKEQSGSTLTITRIARIYDGQFIFLLKSDRLRYWLRSIALRDADETLADLWEEGF